MNSKEGNILVIDDDPDIQITAKMILKKNYQNIDTIDDPAELKKIDNWDFYNLVLLDMNFSPGATSGEEGLRWLEYILKQNPAMIVIMITAYGDVNLAVQSMRIGATDFIMKPWNNKKFKATVDTGYKLSLSQKRLRQAQSTKETLARDLDQSYSQIIGNSTIMKELFRTIDKVAATDVNVLILGENGTGKELVAREIHRKSERSGEVFMNIDLGSISESLFESELFGHVKGAFTDAKEDRMGRFEMANKGTLFLDEIGNLNFPLQSKLLTAIQKKEVQKVGSAKSVSTDVRLISATNMPLKSMIEEEKFRQDLLFRINTVEIHIPPLRKRTEDIPDLVHHFMEIYKNKYHKDHLHIKSNAIKELQKYHWPGNIRELQHILERAVIMAEGKEIKPKDFILDQKKTIETNINTLNLEEVEKQTILKALKKHNYNLSAAAKELGLGRTTMYRKMNKYEL